MQIMYQDSKSMWLITASIWSAKRHHFPYACTSIEEAHLRLESCQPSSVHCFVPFTCFSALVYSSLMLQKKHQLKRVRPLFMHACMHAHALYINTFSGTIPGQCVASNELESLRYRLYSELSDTKKEIDTLRNDLHYWKNETLNILKKYLIHTESKCKWRVYINSCVLFKPAMFI